MSADEQAVATESADVGYRTITATRDFEVWLRSGQSIRHGQTAVVDDEEADHLVLHGWATIVDGEGAV